MNLLKRTESVHDIFGPGDEEEFKPLPVFTLNEGQQNAFDWLVPFILREAHTEYRKCLLSGYAGTGKTFLLNRIVEAVKKVNPKIEFGMTAPTHQAVRQLKKRSEMPGKMTFGTIHSFLALKEKLDVKTGGKYYEADKNTKFGRKIDAVNILIVDEASMLHDTLFDHIENEQRSNPKLIVIYTGDKLQIPPVRTKEEKKNNTVHDAKPFNPIIRKSLNIAECELVEPQRQAAESPIIMYAHAIRTNNSALTIPFIVEKNMVHALELLPTNFKVLRPYFEQYFKSPEFAKDADYCKVTAWRNATVDSFNQEIRKIIYGTEQLSKIINGEKLIMDEPLLEDGKILLTNNEDVYVRDVTVQNVTLFYKRYVKPAFNDNGNPDGNFIRESIEIKVYKCWLVDQDDESYPVQILHEDSQELYEHTYKMLERLAVSCFDFRDKRDCWKEMYGLKEKFAWIKYNYCLTTHTAQGSTYDYCFSIEWDIDHNWDLIERNRIKYVAATRAAKKLFIIK